MPSPLRGMAPSPMSSVNTPLNNETMGSQEDQEYLEKVKQLSKYIGPLQQMISRSTNDDLGKLDKMKKLMDILTNTNKRVPMETLKKCEAVLKRMNFDVVDSNSISEQSSVNPLLEALMKLSKHQQESPNSNTLNDVLQKSFGAPLEAINGSEITLPRLPKRFESEEDSKDDQIPLALKQEVPRLQSQFKVQIDPAQPASQKTICLICELEDHNLPSVPPISVSIPRDYPDSPPICEPDMIDYFSTPFLERVQSAFTSRLVRMPVKFTLSQLLNAWEMSVRSACSPRLLQVSQNQMLLGM